MSRQGTGQGSQSMGASGQGGAGGQGGGGNMTGAGQSSDMANMLPPGWESGLHSAVVLLWVMCGLATVIVLLRLFSRLLIVRIVGLDDILIVPATIFGIVMAVCSHIGWTHTMTDMLLATALSYLAFIPFMLSQTIARLSFAISLLDIMGTNRVRRAILYLLMALQLIECTVALAVCVSVCRQAPNEWVALITQDPECRAQMDHWMINGDQWFVTISDAVFDFSLAFLPALVLSSLRVKTRVKCGLALLMGLGVVAGVSSIMRFWSLRNASGMNADIWAVSNWTTAQTYCLLIAVSMPGAWPLLRRALHLSRARLSTTGGGSRSQGSVGPASALPARKPRIRVKWWPRHHAGASLANSSGAGASRRGASSAAANSAWNSPRSFSRPRPYISSPIQIPQPSVGRAQHDFGGGDIKLKSLPNTPKSPSEECILPPRDGIKGQKAVQITERWPSARPHEPERSDSEKTSWPRPDPGWNV